MKKKWNPYTQGLKLVYYVTQTLVPIRLMAERVRVPPLFSNARVLIDPIGSSIWEMWRNTVTFPQGDEPMSDERSEEFWFISGGIFTHFPSLDSFGGTFCLKGTK